MAPADDPHLVLEVFEATAAACRWPEAEWAVYLLPLLSGDAQIAAVGLPAQEGCTGLSGVLCVGTKLGPTDRPFIYVQQLKDAATRWLQPGDSNGEQRMLKRIILEQFVEGLLIGTAEWVHCHQPTDLAAAISFSGDFSRGRTPKARPTSLGCPTPAPRRRLSTSDPVHHTLTFPVLSSHPRFQSLQVLLPTRRGSLRWQGRGVGGVGSPVIFAASARL